MKFWKWLDGKKSAIASLAGVALSWVQYKGWISGEDALFAAAALTILTGVAVGHKAVKANQGL